MSDVSLILARGTLAIQADMAKQAVATEMVKQQASAEQASADLLAQAADRQKATLPEGQGGIVDITT